jgi:DNA-binding NtrC family response regulator
MKIEGKTALAMVLFVVSVFMVMSKFMLPTTFQVFIEGQSIFIREIPNAYTILDCLIIAIFSFLLGVSAFYLFIAYSVMPKKARAEHEVEPSGGGSESTLPVQDADTDAHVPDTNVQVPETNKSSVALEDDRAGLLKILKGNEKRVIEALMEYGEMNQADLSARTGIPKSTLSRLLQDLEDRSLIFRYEYGMSKMVKKR